MSCWTVTSVGVCGLRRYDDRTPGQYLRRRWLVGSRMEHSQNPAAPRGFAELSGPYWMAWDSPAYRLGTDGRFEPGLGIVPVPPAVRSEGEAASRPAGDS